MERRGGERVGDEKVKKMRERESEKEDKMTWTFVGEEIMMWRCLEENFFFFFFSQFRVLIYNNILVFKGI